VRALSAELGIPPRDPFSMSDDEVDALVCTLAGVDFLRGRAAPPPDLSLAEREGWIWVMLPEGGPESGA
jgi:hypothetical protein